MSVSPSARDLYHTGSGQPVPSPTDAEIATAIRKALAPVLAHGSFNGTDSEEETALISAARAVRQLFPTTTDAISKDTV